MNQLCPPRWAYPETGATRDLRLDFMRGFVMILLFSTHFPYFSALMFIGWERLGVVSLAEIFVLLSGIVTGLVYRKKIERNGLGSAMDALVQRGIKLYLLNVAVILIIGLLRYLPWLDSSVLCTFQTHAGEIYKLYPPLEANFSRLLSDSLLLRSGPHQYQIIGLYAILFMFAPLIFVLLRQGQVKLLLGISWVLYLIHYGSAHHPFRPTGAQFEYAFPIMAWQLLFVHGLVLGYYKEKWQVFLASRAGKITVIVSFASAIGFTLFAWNHPLDQFPPWAQLHWIPADRFMELYHGYFLKNRLGIGRVINLVVLCLSVYIILTHCWQPIERALGWFLIPLGQASLYVFTMHLVLLLIIENTPYPDYNLFWVNTLIHAVLLASMWTMVKTRFLFRFVPH